MLKQLHNQSGMTLVEILVVTALISIILGVSSAFLTQFNRSLQLTTTVKQVCTTLRVARNFAVESRSTSSVKFDLEKKNISVLGNKISGYWHFEDLTDNITTGAFNINGLVKNATLSKGKTGQGFTFAQNSEVNFGSFQKFNIRRGFSLSLWVFPSTFTGSSQKIWEIGKTYILGLKPDNTIFFQSPNGEVPGISFYAPIHNWTLLRVVVDEKGTAIYANDIEIGLMVSGELPDFLEGVNFIVGSNFYGKIDEVALTSLVQLENYDISEEITLKNAPKEIEFAANGQLEPFKHLVPITMNMTRQKRTFTIEVSLMGRISNYE